jgi:5-dehydro-4-deoxyglucarate dehydratase
MTAADATTSTRATARTAATGPATPVPAFGEGPLFFPVTPFDGDDRVDAEILRQHVQRGMEHAPGGVFAACGTGELHALSAAEHAVVVAAVAGEVAGRIPVFAGVGGPLGLVREQIHGAEAAGADGLLLLPPYLVAAPPAGVAAWVRVVAAATDLPVIVYQRANAVLTPAAVVALAEEANVVGLKDGVGDIELMTRIVLAVRSAGHESFGFFNGLPTAELTAPAYRAAGVPRYSSAVFCFAPELASAFCAALAGGDQDTVDVLLRRFFAPLVALRNEVPGYAISLVKAATRFAGLAVGGVRAPLVDPGPEHERRLRELLDVAAELAPPRR